MKRGSPLVGTSCVKGVFYRGKNRERTWRVVFHLIGQRIHTGLGQREQGLSEEVEEAVSMQVQVFMETEERREGRGGREDEQSASHSESYRLLKRG